MLDIPIACARCGGLERSIYVCVYLIKGGHKSENLSKLLIYIYLNVFVCAFKAFKMWQFNI